MHIIVSYIIDIVFYTFDYAVTIDCMSWRCYWRMNWILNISVMRIKWKMNWLYGGTRNYVKSKDGNEKYQRVCDSSAQDFGVSRVSWRR